MSQPGDTESLLDPRNYVEALLSLHEQLDWLKANPEMDKLTNDEAYERYLQWKRDKRN
jgi:hypothetical protein